MVDRQVHTKYACGSSAKKSFNQKDVHLSHSNQYHVCKLFIQKIIKLKIKQPSPPYSWLLYSLYDLYSTWEVWNDTWWSMVAYHFCTDQTTNAFFSFISAPFSNPFSDTYTIFATGGRCEMILDFVKVAYHFSIDLVKHPHPSYLMPWYIKYHYII